MIPAGIVVPAKCPKCGTPTRFVYSHSISGQTPQLECKAGCKSMFDVVVNCRIDEATSTTLFSTSSVARW